MSAKRAKRGYPEDFKTIYGLSTMNWTETISGSFMTGLFMLYLTDYAGIGAFAATLGSTLLIVGRLFDAVNDPLQGYIMDNAANRKIGKYKPFIILSIVMVTIAICMLFSIPTAIAKNPLLVTIWFLIFYLMYDIGISFYAEFPLKQSLSTDPVVRSRMTMWPRITSMIIVVPMAFFIPIVTSVNSGIGNMHATFSLMTLVFFIPVCLISLLGIGLVKEGKHIERKLEEKIRIKDILSMFKTNKPFGIYTLAAIFNGFVWALVFSTTAYYVKWGYCTDLTTGIVDSDKFTSLTTTLGILQLLPTVITAAISPTLIKAFKSPVKVYQLSMWMQAIGGLGLFISMLIGVLTTSPVIFFIFLVIILLGCGLGFVPGTTIGIECMDYGMYKTGKEMHGMIGGVSRFIGKAQTALSAVMVGAILIAIGYQVDSATDTFVGSLSSIPNMLNSFILICGLLPAVLSLIAIFILRFYPITNEVRGEMNAALKEMKEATSVVC